MIRNVIYLSSSLTFDDHVKKLSAVPQMSNFISQEKRILVRTFFDSNLTQFTYCLPAWMFCGRKLNHRVNKLQDRTLRIAYIVITHQTLKGFLVKMPPL